VSPFRRALLSVLLVVGVLAASLTGSLAGAASAASAASVASAASAGDVGSARQQMAAMRARVAIVAARLEQGTRTYDKAQRHLADVQRRERAARRRAAQIDATLTVQQRRLNAIASAAYRRPVPTALGLAMAGGGDGLAQALVAQADLDHVAGSQQDVLLSVVRARLRARALLRTAEQLSADAARTSQQLTRQLRDLRATAARANAELQAAAARLARAEAAERLRRTRIRVSRSRFAVGSGPACTGGSTSGYANGFLPDSVLCPLWEAPGERLVAAAAAAFNRMSRYHAQVAGGPLCVTDSYRSYAGQVSVYERRPGYAATPGRSEHGWGRAVDLCGGVQRYGSDAYAWMKANAGRFGFFHPAWAEPGGSKPEPWHWEFSG
jgi:hypothetical protein